MLGVSKYLFINFLIMSLITPEFEKLFINYPLYSQEGVINPLVLARFYDIGDTGEFLITGYDPIEKVIYYFSIGFPDVGWECSCISSLELYRWNKIPRIKRDMSFKPKRLFDCFSPYYGKTESIGVKWIIWEDSAWSRVLKFFKPFIMVHKKWKLQPQERKGDYTFSGDMHVSKNVCESLSTLEIMQIEHDIQELVQKENDCHYLQTFIDKSGRKIYCIDEMFHWSICFVHES